MKNRYSPHGIILLAISLLSLLTVRLASADLDFGDNSSATLTNKAWDALNGADYRSAIGYTSRCIELYKQTAEEQQRAMGHAGDTKGSWALNDVATCYFIRGKAKEGAQKNQEAIEDYKYVSEHLTKAECKDGKGNKWSPAQVAKKRIMELENPTADATPTPAAPPQ